MKNTKNFTVLYNIYLYEFKNQCNMNIKNSNFEANKVVISLSGGLDSTCLLLKLLSDNKEVRAYSFKYGQKHQVELEKVQRNIAILQSMGLPVTHQIINLEDVFSDSASSLHKGGEAIPHGMYDQDNMKSTVVENRNIIFSSIIYGKALSWANKTKENVYITQGIHAGDHCFTGDTLIFTPNGLKRVDELQIGEDVYSFDGDNLKTEITKLQDIIHKGTNNTIYKIQTTSGSIKLTSEHKVYVCELSEFDSKFGYNKTFSHKLVKDLKIGDKLITPFLQVDYSTTNRDFVIDLYDIVDKCLKMDDKYTNYKLSYNENELYIIGNNKSTTPLKRYVSVEKLLELMAWYITEGWTSNSWKTNPNASRFLSSFSQSLYKNFENCDSINECVKYFNNGKLNSSKKFENGLPKEVTYTFSSILSVLMNSCGTCSHDKHIPNWIMNILNKNPELIYNFLYTMICGDGHYDKISGIYTYTTNSEKLMQDVSFLAKKIGFFVKINKNKNNCYIVTFGNTNKKQGLVRFGESALTEITNIEIIQYEEPVAVFDLSIEKNHNFFAGDNGNILISNSIYPDCRPESQQMARELYKISNWGSERVDFIAPFVNIDKGEVLHQGILAMRSMGFSEDQIKEVLRNTHTCYDPNDKGESCGQCGSCTERIEAFVKNGMVDPVSYALDQEELAEIYEATKIRLGLE